MIRRTSQDLTGFLTAFLGLVLVGACTGPAVHVQNPAGHRVFVDGIAMTTPELPFRYYGTSRWDALPADGARGPDWSLQRSSGPIPLPPPASPWLFPLDFPLELLRRTAFGREDTVVPVQLAPTPPDLLVEPEVAPTGQAELEVRARRARIAR